MKKLLLFTAFMYYLMSASAQQPMNLFFSPKWFKNSLQPIENLNRHVVDYNEKVDSIFISYGTKQFYTYDEHFNVTKIKSFILFGPLSFTNNKEFFYDEDGQIIMMIETSIGEDIKKEKTEYSYSDGMLSSYIVYENENGVWEQEEKVEYYHNPEENWQQAIKYRMDDNGWIEDEKVESTIIDGRIIAEYHSNWNLSLNDWLEDNKVEYTYDSENHCTDIYTYYKIGSMEDFIWVNDEKELFAYDNYGNCTSSEEYEFDPAESVWKLLETTHYHYDITVSNSNIAGFWVFYDETMANMNNKLLSAESTASDGTPFTTQFYYSSCTGIGEVTASKLSFWPNPVIEILNLTTENLQQVEIFSMDGRQVMHLEKGLESIDVSHLSQGVYLMKGTYKDGSKTTQKFLKQ